MARTRATAMARTRAVSNGPDARHSNGPDARRQRDLHSSSRIDIITKSWNSPP